MKQLVLGSLLALMLSISPVIPQVGASEFYPGMIPNVSIGALGKTGLLATWETDLLAWLRSTLGQYLSNTQNNYPTNSVPIPGTLLLFGGGFAGLMIWRQRRQRP
ncbi:MAG: hypothetical protein CV089_23835 [Nitrospira sp. WS110]|nr:hypothetical protein [Nitrospira sp. WS110]